MTAGSTFQSTAVIFDGITAVSAFGSMVVFGIGAWIAWRQLKLLRSEAAASQMSQIAVDLLIAAQDVSDAIDAIRSNTFRTDGEASDLTIEFLNVIWDRLARHDTEFRSLRRAQIEAKHLLRIERVDQAVEELFEIRVRIRHSLRMLEVYSRQKDKGRLSEKEVEHRRNLAGSFCDEDVLRIRQLAAVSVLEEVLAPIARLENSTH